MRFKLILTIILIVVLNSCVSYMIETADTMATTKALFGKSFTNLHISEYHSDAFGFHGDGFVNILYRIPNDKKKDIKNNFIENKSNLPRHCYLWNDKDFKISKWKDNPINNEDLELILSSFSGDSYMYKLYSEVTKGDFYYSVIKKVDSNQGYLFVIDKDFNHLFSISVFY